MSTPVTQAHRLAAFEAMHWRGWTFEAAQANDMRRRLIECRATAMAAAERRALEQAQRQPVRRVRLDAQGNVASWCTQIVMGPRTPSPQTQLLDETTCER